MTAAFCFLGEMKSQPIRGERGGGKWLERFEGSGITEESQGLT